MSDSGYPCEPGFWWAKSDKDFKWWNLIVQVYGDVPYLNYSAWNLADDTILQGKQAPTSFIFGPKIDDPDKKRGEAREGEA